MKVLKSGEQQITLYYGKQTLNGNVYLHTGIDIVRTKNNLDKIVAAQTGKVVKVVANVKKRDLTKGYGNYIVLEHGDKTTTKYGHLKYQSIKVKVGQIVEKGEEIGYMGDTGYTFGAHLHFEVSYDSKTVDPLPYLTDEKYILPYIEKTYVSENYVVTTDVLNVRKGPGKKYDIIRYTNLTANAKEQMANLVNYPANGYVKGMEFTALNIKKFNNEIWAQTPSGWVCICDNDGNYCIKL